MLQKLKAKIVRLHNIQLNNLLFDNNTAERVEGEKPAMYNVLQMRRRRNERTITALRDQDGITQTTPRGIARTLVTYMGEKYKIIEVNTQYVQQFLSEIKRTKLTSTMWRLWPGSRKER
jgi:ribosomal protein S19